MVRDSSGVSSSPEVVPLAGTVARAQRPVALRLVLLAFAIDVSTCAVPLLWLSRQSAFTFDDQLSNLLGALLLGSPIACAGGAVGVGVSVAALRDSVGRWTRALAVVALLVSSTLLVIGAGVLIRLAAALSLGAVLLACVLAGALAIGGILWLQGGRATATAAKRLSISTPDDHSRDREK